MPNFKKLWMTRGVPSAIVYYLLCLDKRRDAETRYVGKVGKYRQYSHSSMLSHWLPPLLGLECLACGVAM